MTITVTVHLRRGKERRKGHWVVEAGHLLTVLLHEQLARHPSVLVTRVMDGIWTVMATGLVANRLALSAV